MKAVRQITAVLLFCLFFVWSYWGSFSALAAPLVLLPAALFVFAILFFTPKSLSQYIENIEDFFLKRGFALFPALAFAISLYISLKWFSGLPFVPDEVNYKYLAQAILDGKITSELHPHYEFFNFLYTVPSVGGAYSIYQIGFPLFLALFLALGVPWLANPLLVAFSVFLTGRIAEIFYDRKTAVIAMFFASTSVFITVLGGTMMAHPFCAAATLGAFYFAVCAEKSNDSRQLLKNVVVSALFISVLLLARPQNALFALFFTVLYLFLKLKFSKFFKTGVVYTLIISVFFVLLVYSNYVITGSVAEFKHQKFWDISEPVDDCMGIGLGKGCKFSANTELPEEGLNFTYATEITRQRLEAFLPGLTLNPLFFLFILLPFFKRSRGKLLIFNDYFMLFGFMIFFVAYYFYYFPGVTYGARYYFEGSFFLFPLMAQGVVTLLDTTGRVEKAAKLKYLTESLLIAGLALQFLINFPATSDTYSKGWWATTRLLSSKLQEKNVTDGVVFINPDYFYSSGLPLMNIHKIDANRLIFAIDLGLESNQKLMDYYKGRRFFWANFHREGDILHSKEPLELDLFEIFRDPAITKITVELEHKSYPIDGKPDYCNRYLQMGPIVNNYAGFALPPEFNDGRLYFFCRFTGTDQFYTFGQNFTTAGRFLTKVTFAAHPVGGKFEFRHNGSTHPIDFHSEHAEYKTIEFVEDIKQGLNLFTFLPKAAGSYFIIDKIEFFPLAEEKNDGKDS